MPGKAVYSNETRMAEGDRIARAMARIEAAAGRIDAAARPTRDDDPELARKYARLREEAGSALADLDRLIGALER